MPGVSVLKLNMACIHFIKSTKTALIKRKLDWQENHLRVYIIVFLMLAINQTAVFALFMVTIDAMIGTANLSQYILKALSDKNGIGNGLILGLCVAFIVLAIDYLARTWVDQQKIALGLA